MSGVEEIDGRVSLDFLKHKMAKFAKERDWDHFHTPRNLLLALKEEERIHLGEELSDVLLYLVRLADMCGIDLGKAALRKLQLNAIKYKASNKCTQHR
ncbi:hypothetical protein GOBAR_DD22385 [Gossypium barbadense]|nr:hypothetical protein GOBAR_DD22385 [Gossypium barbadense]